MKRLKAELCSKVSDWLSKELRAGEEFTEGRPSFTCYYD